MMLLLLQRPDVGIAIGAGTDVAIESADAVLVRNDLLDAVSAVKLSKAVIRNIKENLFWAFFYNSIRMIQIQPQINEIKYKHAGDKDRIADEQMELFKKAHYSPMLGMVPMLLQIPLVLGLINVIYNPMQHLMHIKTSVCDQIVGSYLFSDGCRSIGGAAHSFRQWQHCRIRIT